MKQSESTSSKKIVVNDLLCFVQNNISTLSQLSICRLCEETYSFDEINTSFQELKDNVHVLDPLFNVYPTDDSRRETLKAIIMLFNSKACEYLQFVSTTCNMPKMRVYNDMLSATCVLDEIKELKQLVKQQTEILSAGLHQLSNDFKRFKKEHGSKCRSSINDDDIIEPTFDTFTSLLPSLNHFVEKNDSIFTEVNESSNNCLNDSEVSPMSLSREDNEKVMEVKDVVMVGRPSDSLLPATMRRTQTTTENHTKTIDVRSSIQQLPGKFHKKHSCKICGYAGNLTDVTRHMRTHTGERPFSCPFCSSRFSLRGNMIKHLARKHGTCLSRIPPGTKSGKHTPRKYAPKKVDPALNSTQAASSKRHESNLSKKIFGVNSQKTSQPIDSDDKVNSDETSLDVAIPVSELQEAKLEETEQFPTSSFSMKLELNENDDQEENALLTATSLSTSSIINDISQATSAVATYNPMLHMQANQSDVTSSSSIQAMDRFLSNQLSKKKHRCDICGYTSTASDVTRHKRTHTGERPFSCPVCGARFSLRGNMTKHVVRMHPEYTAESQSNTGANRLVSV